MAISDKIRRLFDRSTNRKPQVELSPYSTSHELLSEFIYSDMRERSDRFLDVVDDAPMVPGEKEGVEIPYEGISDLGGDVFMAHVDSADEIGVRPKDEIRKSRELHRAIMEQYLANDDYRKAHLMTRNDPVGAALATMAAMGEVKESLETTLKEHAKRAEEMRGIEEQIENIENQIPPTPEGGLPGAPDGTEDASGSGGGLPGGMTEEQLEAMADQLSNLEQTLDEKAKQQAQSGMGADVAEAMDRAAEEAKDMAEGYLSLPGVGGGNPPPMAPDKLIEFAERWRDNPTMRQVAKIVGRLEREMQAAAASNIQTEEGVPLDVETGRELRKVLSHEIINLVSDDPNREMLFYKRFGAAQLMQWQMFEDEDAGMGDGIFAMDISSSMSGQKNVAARAIALAMGSLMNKLGRGFGVVEFNTYAQGEFYFPKSRRLDIEQMVDFASRGVSGGTDITTGVQRAFEIIKENSGEYRKADIVLLTDGSDTWADDDVELRRQLTEAGVRVHAITLGMKETVYTNNMGDTTCAAFDLMNPTDTARRIAQGVTA